MCLPVLLGVPLGDVHVEIGLHLVDEADVLARELAAGAREGAQVGADEVGAGRSSPSTGGSSASRRSAWRASSAGSGAGSLSTCATQCGIAGEGVDVAFLDPVEPQTEHQIFTDQGGGVHALNANCKT